mmetsp:Transcript_55023/g.63290  ORF Transcript_55023/g.63290 Transcript_55023/m.63290 type:complete len:395 (-) Transcript_55023:176-1360(-)
MRTTLALVLLAAFCIFQASAADCRSKLATADFLTYANCLGYPVESHIVTTDDGYQLKLFRLQAKGTRFVENKPVILMWHGLLDSADSWIINEEHLAPGLIFANQGHDIWFGNSRGNKYSLGHRSLISSSSKQFWDFSWQHMSEHDLPAAFAYIAKLTGQKINYVGHSQGTTQMFALLANPAGKKADVVNNLRKFAALGPVTYLANIRSDIAKSMARMPLLPEILQQAGKFGLLLPNWISSKAGSVLCKMLPWTCSFGMKIASDDDPGMNNQAAYENFAGHFPAGTSVTDILHWKQLLVSGEFKMYDYGKAMNNEVYGQDKPHKYDLSLISEDVALFVGTDDLIANTVDASKTFDDMRNAKKEIHFYPMGHLTFMIGKDMKFMDDLTKFLDITQN